MGEINTHRPGKRSVNRDQLREGLDRYLDYMRKFAKEPLTAEVDYSPVRIEVTTEIAGHVADAGLFYVCYVQLPVPMVFPTTEQDGCIILVDEGLDAERRTFIGAEWPTKWDKPIQTFHDVEASCEGRWFNPRDVVQAFEAKHHSWA